MSLPSFSVRNRALVNMLMIVILLAGAGFSLSLVREMFPESRPNRLMISAIHPGVQPVEIEKAITIKIEEAVRDIDGVDRVDSTVGEGFTTTVLTLLSEVHDVDSVLQEVKNEVDAIQDFPDDLEQITVTKLEPKLPVISVAIYGPGDEAALKRAARRMRDDLLRLPGVSDVRISGTREDEISVEVRPEKLLEYDITFDEIAEAIRRADLDISGGQLRGSRARVAVRTLGEKERGSELEDLVVRSAPDGRKVRLSDVAVIRDQFVESDLKSYFNGKRGVNCTVYKTAAQDAIQIADEIKAYVKGKQNVSFDLFGFEAAYERPWYVKPFALGAAGFSWLVGKINGRPDPMQIYEESRTAPFDHNFQVALHTDLSRFVQGRLNLMLRTGFSGLVLVLISLNLFLNWRVALWTAMGLPVSFLGTFMVMWFTGVTINLISLFGLIIVLGIIVDDAIVIGENIYRHVSEDGSERGSLSERVLAASREIAKPIFFAILIIIAVFLPLYTLSGIEGKLFIPLVRTVTYAMVGSLIMALLITPALSAWVFRHGKKAETREFIKWMRRPYIAVLEWTLEHHRATVGAYALAITASLAVFPFLGSEFLPTLDEGSVLLQVTMPASISLDRAVTLADNIESELLSFPEVTLAIAKTGRAELGGDPEDVSNTEIYIGLKPRRQWETARSKTDLVAAMREKLSTIPGVQLNFSQVIQLRVDEMISGITAQIAITDAGVLLE